ncbi:hypothetical protein LTR86_009814 [Recurvomyces mirabilis]|nr:hypothetical protein LTR86_009814 [Recurvomyces mirabilis]
MANQAPLSYSAAASGASAASTSDPPTDADKVAAQPSKAQEQAVRGDSAPTTDGTRQQGQNGHSARRSPSPRHQPRGVAENEAVYILTLQTDKPHHDRMTALRKKYFPPRLNKLEAHLTLFHALPQSKLDSAILPTIQDVVAKNHPFKVTVTKPFRLRHGIALSIPKHECGSKIQGIHRALQVPWKDQGWLSEQDAGGMQAHYTIMNKVDSDAEVVDAFDEVSREFRGDEGTVEGLGLWSTISIPFREPLMKSKERVEDCGYNNIGPSFDPATSRAMKPTVPRQTDKSFAANGACERELPPEPISHSLGARLVWPAKRGHLARIPNTKALLTSHQTGI